MGIRVNPSILAADFANFEREFASITHADLIHVDVMDNHFVPNLTFGLPMVQRLQQITPRPLDIHLMIDEVDDFAPAYAECGAYSVTLHAEASKDPVATAKNLKASGARSGIAIKPGTRISEIVEFLPFFDQVLIMTVEPGFGGQALIEETLTKVSEARRLIDAERLDIWLQVDGGIDEQNIARVAEFGADTFVAGSAVFKSEDRNRQIDHLRALAETGFKHAHL